MKRFNIGTVRTSDDTNARFAGGTNTSTIKRMTKNLKLWFKQMRNLFSQIYNKRIVLTLRISSVKISDDFTETVTPLANWFSFLSEILILKFLIRCSILWCAHYSLLQNCGRISKLRKCNRSHISSRNCTKWILNKRASHFYNFFNLYPAVEAPTKWGNHWKCVRNEVLVPHYVVYLRVFICTL